MTDYAKLLDIANAAVDMASELLRTHQPGQLTAKGDRDMATEVDFEIERRVRAFLRDATPDIAFLGEEEGSTGDTSELMWALDPIDGTANFVHGIPLCGTSLGLVNDSRPVLGVIDLPFLGARYTGAEHSGAYVNDEPITASATDNLAQAVVAIGDYAVGDNAEQRNVLRLAVTRQLATRAQRVRMHGSAATDLAWLANGKIDALITLSNKPWDMAAGVVIAREAGAHVVDKDGSPHDLRSQATIAASPGLLTAIVEVLVDAEASLA
ncbi:MAG TPA: inositol monophosphatase family protein [Chloroflexota bacterium]|nr:inositol monophosphatase family protein [Chloroflexota bacterium]